MAHPEWALKHKTKGTELRNIGGRYYLYRVSSKYDKERKVSRKITHEMLGRITEKDGLIPRGQKAARAKAEVPQVSVKEYGATHLLQNIGSDIFSELQKVFPNQCKQLVVLAMHRLYIKHPLRIMNSYIKSLIYQKSLKT